MSSAPCTPARCRPSGLRFPRTLVGLGCPISSRAGSFTATQITFLTVSSCCCCRFSMCALRAWIFRRDQPVGPAGKLAAPHQGGHSRVPGILVIVRMFFPQGLTDGRLRELALLHEFQNNVFGPFAFGSWLLVLLCFLWH